MNLTPITVECYAGYKADESPRFFYWNDQKYEISEILDRWHQGSYNPRWLVSNYFKVKITTGQIYILKHEIEIDEWYIVE